MTSGKQLLDVTSLIGPTRTAGLLNAFTKSLTADVTDDYSAGTLIKPAYKGDGILNTLTVHTAGTGYKDGDVLGVVSLAGGLSGTVTATVSSAYRDVATVTVSAAGSGYDVATHATTGGTGAGCTIGVATIGAGGEIETVTVVAGGSHYTVGDVLTIAAPGTLGTVTVASVGAGTGAVASVAVAVGGTGYEIASALATTGGTSPGTGCKVNVTVLTARTVTRHNYIDVNTPVLTKGAAVSGAALLRLDAALGTHLATTNSDKTGGAKSGTIKVNVAGTIFHIQLYAD